MSCAVQIILCKPLINQSMHLKFCYVIIKKINIIFLLICLSQEMGLEESQFMVAHLMVCSFTVLISITGRALRVRFVVVKIEEGQLLRIEYSEPLICELIFCYSQTAILSVVCQASL